MTDLERFHACMNYQEVDHAPFWTWGEWPETIERWEREGYDKDNFDLNMGADIRQTPGGWFDPNPPLANEILDETEEYILYSDDDGIVKREMKNNPLSSMPQFVKFPVETRAEFRKFWKERMQPDLAKRIGPDWKTHLQSIRERPIPLNIIAGLWGGFFGPLRNLVGVEKLCTLFCDDPVFLEEMMDADADFLIAMMTQVLEVVTIDAFIFWEDMAYKTAPLISPNMVRRYMLPRYKRVVEFLRGRNVQFIGLDSDGQVDPLIPVWLDAGINVLFPFEVQAGMDVVEVRRKYGKDLRIWGGVNKRALAQGAQAIDAELDRVKPLIKEGGYIPHTDHSCPPDISFGDYCYYMKRLTKICNEI